MLVRTFGWAALVIAGLTLLGCGGGSSGGGSVEATTTADGGPEAAISQFLAAVKNGDDAKASSLLTDVARQKTKEHEIVVAPPGSETASFKVLESEVEGSAAQVGADWTDLDANGSPRTDRVVWMLKKQADAWRISGMATRIFPDMPPVVLNFEDPEDMMAKQQAAEEEMARRAGQPGTMTAENPDSGTDQDPTVR
jgi:hypothetical protein